MLIDDLSVCIKDMKYVNSVETDAKNQKQKEDTISDYKQLILKVDAIFRKLRLSHSLIGFVLPIEIIKPTESTLTELDSMADNTDIDLDQFLNLKKSVDKMDHDLAKCWDVFYRPKMIEKKGQIGVVFNIYDDQNKLHMIDHYISAALDWKALLDVHGGKFTIQLAKESMDQADAILNQLDLKEDVKNFLQRVSSRSATLADLTPDVEAWIRNKNLQNRFRFSFSN